MAITAQADFGSIFFWGIVIIALIAAGFVAVTWVKRWVKEGDDNPAGGFTLGELRRLHQERKMSDAEYEKAKAMIIEAAKAAAAKRTQPPPQKPTFPPQA